MLKRSKLTRVGVFIEWLADGYADPIFEEIARCGAERGVEIVCFVGGLLEMDYPKAKRNTVHWNASPRNIDGAVVVTMGNNFTAAQFEDYFRRFENTPICSVAMHWSGLPSVEIENKAGVRAGVRHLIRSHGRRRIACIRGPSSSSEADKRFGAYRDVLDEFGIEFDEQLVTSGSYIRRHGTDAVRQLLDERHVQFDAIVSANDAMALGALEELDRRGIRVPEDVALFGFDDIDEGRFAKPPLSTVRQPMREHARRAFELVMDQLNGIAINRRTLIDSHLVLRRSCGCSVSGGTALSSMPPALTNTSHAKRLDEWSKACCNALVEFLEQEDDQLCERLAQAMLGATQSGDARPFLNVLEQQLDCKAASGADLLQLLPILEAKRAEARGGVGTAREQEKIEKLLRDAEALVSEATERTQAQLRFHAHAQMIRLLRLNDSLMLVKDFEEMAQTIAKELQSLGIRACFLCEWDGPDVPSEWARLIFGCDTDKALPLPDGGVRFPVEAILPNDLISPQTTDAWLVCPLLHSEVNVRGYVVMLRGTAESFVYDSLVGQMGACYRRLDLMKRVVEEVRLREAADRERIEREMRIATEIQTGILPASVAVPGLDISGSMQPATEVGGDYYDVVPVSDGCWIGIGDVAGHGLPTGLVMLMCQSVIGGLVRSQPDAGPESLLAFANRLLYDNIRMRMHQDEHVTLALIRYRTNGELCAAGAHEAMLIWRANERRVERIETDGVWAGILQDILPMTRSITTKLEPNDLLVLYTDGVTEARNAQGVTYGEDRLAANIVAFHDGPASLVRERILESVFEWMARQDDDVTLLVARYGGT